MTNKKSTPKHITKKEFNHPAKDSHLIQVFEDVPDPRGPSCNFLYSLTSILFISFTSIICGANDWVEIEALGISMKDWLNRFVDVSNGIPSQYTFRKIFSIIDPDHMEHALIKATDIIREKVEGDIISFDGKSLRGTSASERGDKAIHLLNAWSRESGVCIGHRKVKDKSNEITAMPELMDLLDLTGTIVTTDALNTQKSIAKNIINKNADYVLPVKENHSNLLEEIQTIFLDAEKNGYRGVDGDSYETLEKERGRVEGRKYYSIDVEDLPSKKEWEGIKSLGKVIRERTAKGKTSREEVYYISSCEIDAKLFANAVRGHWGVENSLHWVLDVTFREDKIRYRDRIGARNLAVIRKLSMSALSKDKSLKCGKAAKRLVAASNPEYREGILKNLF